MANEEALAPLWEFIRARGITFPASTGTLSIAGHEFVVEIPDDLVEDAEG